MRFDQHSACERKPIVVAVTPSRRIRIIVYINYFFFIEQLCLLITTIVLVFHHSVQGAWGGLDQVHRVRLPTKTLFMIILFLLLEFAPQFVPQRVSTNISKVITGLPA